MWSITTHRDRKLPGTATPESNKRKKPTGKFLFLLQFQVTGAALKLVILIWLISATSGITNLMATACKPFHVRVLEGTDRGGNNTSLGSLPSMRSAPLFSGRDIWAEKPPTKDKSDTFFKNCNGYRIIALTHSHASSYSKSVFCHQCQWGQSEFYSSKSAEKGRVRLMTSLKDATGQRGHAGTEKPAGSRAEVLHWQQWNPGKRWCPAVSA